VKNIKTQIKKLQQLNEKSEKIRKEIWTEIWAIFKRYIKIKPVRFIHSSGWEVTGEGICFFGQDGAVGRYNYESIIIPIRYFLDPEKEFAALEMECAKKDQLKAEWEKKEEREKDRREFERLKQKLEANQ